MICTEYAATITKFGRTNVVGNIQEDPYLRSTYWIAKTQLGNHISPVVLRYTNHRCQIVAGYFTFLNVVGKC